MKIKQNHMKTKEILEKREMGNFGGNRPMSRFSGFPITKCFSNVPPRICGSPEVSYCLVFRDIPVPPNYFHILCFFLEFPSTHFCFDSQCFFMLMFFRKSTAPPIFEECIFSNVIFFQNFRVLFDFSNAHFFIFVFFQNSSVPSIFRMSLSFEYHDFPEFSGTRDFF